MNSILNNLSRTYTLERKGRTEEQVNKSIAFRFKDKNLLITKPIFTDTTITFTTYSKISYEALAKKLIAERYSIEDELKLHREERENPYNEEYLEYVRYVKECLARARQWIEERNNMLGV